jgi:hypothetical protein
MGELAAAIEFGEASYSLLCGRMEEFGARLDRVDARIVSVHAHVVLHVCTDVSPPGVGEARFMSPLPVPRHLRGAPRALAQSFWILVISTLGFVIAFVVVASIDPVASPVIGGTIVVLMAMWALHLRAVRAHRIEISRDPAFRHARERRGF